MPVTAKFARRLATTRFMQRMEEQDERLAPVCSA
jgi:hypothetical protein